MFLNARGDSDGLCIAREFWFGVWVKSRVNNCLCVITIELKTVVCNTGTEGIN